MIFFYSTVGDNVCNNHSDESDANEPDQKQATAKKIIDLLTEIETTNLVDKPVVDTFHPCPLCSGRLITV